MGRQIPFKNKKKKKVSQAELGRVSRKGGSTKALLEIVTRPV